MDTREHTELGNSLKVADLKDNPYLRIDDKGVLYLQLHRFETGNTPSTMPLEISAGEIVAMAGDYFTQANWTMDLSLPTHKEFQDSRALGEFLISRVIDPKEEDALITAYNNLASPEVTRKEIDKIYNIDSSNYVPSFPTLNFYIQQLMFYLRVKDYGEMLVRNQTHFTPWSVRVYILGHNIALRHAQIACELKKIANDSNYESDKPHVIQALQNMPDTAPRERRAALIDLSHKYHALAYGIELFTFHYYSDHFATGHMSMVGDLRVLLGQRFGLWGSILANNLHDEINRVGVYTVKAYDPTPDNKEAPIPARGDSSFDSTLNEPNRAACLAGMHESLEDIDKVLMGDQIPAQNQFGGLEHMPDVDYNSRQHQPLIVLCQDKIYYRTDLKNIHPISPTEYENLRKNPEQNGYTELPSKWAAFVLVMKLRLFPNSYKGEIVPATSHRVMAITRDEQERNPNRLPVTPLRSEPGMERTLLAWGAEVPVLDAANAGALGQFGLLRRPAAAGGHNAPVPQTERSALLAASQ